ncbi:cyclic nucleotide-binding domain-containing protein [Rhodomicrobium sp. Az07]|uniref:cyclic nucleotide-binding domain-containing protein n=1 Tax=Rhodomicrobium sp. Az07 TaxID=2839034 RepID=UPI001BE805DC|nr:cyclic nucleotide-binding domain-containing protein [Rhodomicrobium sp. Az07]MBT3071760.1 cyclic nucleotide-binding domain-containing protein [Rhodomicrobium sp. Az07]
MLDAHIELLRALPIFRGLGEKQLAAILDVGKKVYFEPGHVLTRKDVAGDCAFLVLSGAVRCKDFPGMATGSEPIGPGALVGEMAMLVDTVYPLTVEATERVRALALQRSRLTRVMRRDPGIARQLADNLLLRLRSFARDLRHFELQLEQKEDASPPAAQARTATEIAVSSAAFDESRARGAARRFGGEY